MNSVTTFDLNSEELDEINGAFFGYVRSVAYTTGYALGKASRLFF